MTEKEALIDAYFDSFEEASAEKARRQVLNVDGEQYITRVEPSRYGGFRVWTMPADVYIELLSDSLDDNLPNSLSNINIRNLGKIPGYGG